MASLNDDKDPASKRAITDLPLTGDTPGSAGEIQSCGKTDLTGAEAICEAVTRPTMRFVPIKVAEQQAVLVLHRTHDLLVRRRTMLVNALRGHIAELGIIAPQGIALWNQRQPGPTIVS